MALWRATRSGLLRATGRGAGSSKRSTTSATKRCSTTGTSTRPAACAVRRCAWSGSSSARPRLSIAVGNGGVGRRARSSGLTWPGTSRASRRPLIYLMALRCSSTVAPKVAPLPNAGGARSAHWRRPVAGPSLLCGPPRVPRASSDPSAGRPARLCARRTTSRWPTTTACRGSSTWRRFGES